MIKKILVSALAVGALALGAPAAQAEHTEFDCGFDTVAQETVTGGQNTFTGAAYGYVASPTPGESVEIICYVRVDGNPGSPPAPGTSGSDGPNEQVDTYAAQVTYTAEDTQDVDLCAVVYVEGVAHEGACFETTTTQIPPQEVIDLINEILALTGIVDPTVCPILIGMSGSDVPGVVDIRSDGDVYIAGIWFWDCPVYGVSGT